VKDPATKQCSQPAWADAPEWPLPHDRQGCISTIRRERRRVANHGSPRRYDGFIRSSSPPFPSLRSSEREQLGVVTIERGAAARIRARSAVARPACAVRLREPNVTPRGLTCDTCGAKSNGEPVQCKGRWKSLLLGAGNSRGKKAHLPGESANWAGQLVTIDMNPNCGADIVHDLEQRPLPFRRRRVR
jgi:hypothetical protein